MRRLLGSGVARIVLAVMVGAVALSAMGVFATSEKTHALTAEQSPGSKAGLVKSKPPKVKHHTPSVISHMQSTLSDGWGELPGKELNLQACLVFAAEFSDAAKSITEAKQLDLTKDEMRIVSKYKQSLIRYQIQCFPLLRRKFTSFYADALWNDDVTVKTSGSGNRAINFTGGLFVANRNKKDFLELALPNLRAMRFTEAKFRWYEDSESTYWELGSPKDGEIAVIKGLE